MNAGAYAFDGFLFRALREVKDENAAREYYLPDLIAIYRAHGRRVRAVRGVAEEALGVNTREELARVEGVLLGRLRSEWMGKGVRMILPETIYLEPSVELAPDVTLWPGVVLKGKTRVGEGCEVGAYAILEDTVLEPGARVESHTVAQGPTSTPGPPPDPSPGSGPGRSSWRRCTWGTSWR